MKTSIVMAALFAVTPATVPALAKAADMVIVSSADIQYEAATALPPGAEIAVLDGDLQASDQMSTFRLKFPAGYRVPPHWHGITEYVTVLSGQLALAMGENFAAQELQILGEGDFFVMPREMPHYAMALEETIIQLHAYGPFTIQYVNPEDDPRN